MTICNWVSCVERGAIEIGGLLECLAQWSVYVVCNPIVGLTRVGGLPSRLSLITLYFVVCESMCKITGNP